MSEASAQPDPAHEYPTALLRALAIGLTAGFFALDSALPLGVAAGVPYVAVMLLALRLPRSREVTLFALGCSALTLAGIAFSPGPGGAEWWKVLTNRGLALFAIWVTATIGLQRRGAQRSLHSTREVLRREGREHAVTLAENQARLSGIIQSAMDGIVSVDDEQKIIVFNRAAEEMFRTTAADAIGEPLDRFIPEHVRAVHPDLLRELGQSDAPSRRPTVQNHVSGLRADGTEFPMELAVSQLEIRGETIRTAVIRDITERVRAESELAAHASQEAVIAKLGLRALLGMSLETTMQESVETLARILDVEFAEVFELLPDESELRLVAGVGWKPDLVGNATVSARRETLAGFTLSAERPVVVQDLASERRFSASPIFRDHDMKSGVSVIIHGDERPVGVLGAHTSQSRHFSENDVDFVQSLANFIGLVARRARAEEALRITEKRARDAEELASIGTIMAGIAHDVGTPMNIIIGYADMLERSLENPKARERAAIIKEQVGRIVRLVDTLLNMARPSKGSMVPIELEEVIEASLSFFQEKLKKHAIVVERDFEPALTVRGDADRLQQVFLNLFLNAVDAMPDGGVLAIGLHRLGDREVEIRVRDNGTGIAPESLERIFEPFFTSKHRGEGTGLGLLVSKGIVVDHGGSIEVHSQLGSSTEFRIRLPIEGRRGGGQDAPAGTS